MAERYEEAYRRDRGYRPGERGLMDRAGDEVRSWFGDDDAERRRQQDDRNQYRTNTQYGGSEPYRGDQSRGDQYRGDNQYRGDSQYRGETSRDRSDSSGDRSYGSYADRAFYGTYDDRSGWSRDRSDAGYRPDGWRGLNYPSSQTYGNRDMSTRDRGFAGHGPRGYQRSDTRINEDVCDCLCDSAEIDARNIDVTVSNGEVTLNGSVSDRDQKRRAEDLIEQISGVREVHNNLRTGSMSTDTSQTSAQATTQAASSSSGTTGEQPGNVLGVGGGAPDRASSAGRR